MMQNFEPRVNIKIICPFNEDVLVVPWAPASAMESSFQDTVPDLRKA